MSEATLVTENKISEDSINLLVFIKQKGKTSSDEIMKYVNWDIKRIRNAIDFLYEEEHIHKPLIMSSGRIISIKCTSKGILIIEKPKEFRKKNGIDVTFDFNIDSLLKVDIDKIFEAKLF